MRIFGIQPTFWASVCTAGALAILIGLGTWQLDRLHWKEELIAAREAALAAAPMALPAVGDITGDNAGLQRVSVTGRYRHDAELYLGPRSHRGTAGVHVLTPLVPAAGEAVLVNRGFVPDSHRDPATRPQGQIAGPVTITGVLRRGFAPGAFTPDNVPAANQWYWPDLPAMAQAAGLALYPGIVEAEAMPVPGGLPIGGVTQMPLRNDHLQYAITWYSLAAALVVIYLLYHRRRRTD